MQQLLGKKRGMTRLFTEGGDVEVVTVIEAGPCPVVRVKSVESDGYDALQIGFGDIRKKLVNKARAGQFGDSEPKRYLREVRLDAPSEQKVGDVLTVEMFKPGQRVDVMAISKGLGFQGGVRRHGFSGGPKTHGQSDRMRAPGSVGSSSYPSRTFRGQRMAGRMGRDRVTVRNLTIVDVRADEGLILIRGAIPGKPNSLVTIKGTKRVV